MGISALGLGILMYFVAYYLHKIMKRRGIELA